MDQIRRVQILNTSILEGHFIQVHWPGMSGTRGPLRLHLSVFRIQDSQTAAHLLRENTELVMKNIHGIAI